MEENISNNVVFYGSFGSAPGRINYRTSAILKANNWSIPNINNSYLPDHKCTYWQVIMFSATFD